MSHHEVVESGRRFAVLESRDVAVRPADADLENPDEHLGTGGTTRFLDVNDADLFGGREGRDLSGRGPIPPVKLHASAVILR